jgi:hypothetical protein
MIDKLLKALDYLDKAEYLLSLDTTQTAEHGSLDALITRFVDVRGLRERTKALHASVSELEARLSEELVPEALRDSGFTTVHHRLGRVTLNTRTQASVIDRPKAYEWLRGHDLGDIIIETVNSQTLSATASALMEKGDELPEEYFKTWVKTYTSVTKPGPSRKRKASEDTDNGTD